MSTYQSNSYQLIDDCRETLQGIRRALIELYGAVGADPDAPQEVSRQFGLNRNLTWKLSRVINATDPFDALNHLPGNQGMDLAIRAFEKSGAPGDTSEQVRQALLRFRDLATEHTGTREHLELTLESMGVFERDTTAESGRELAFRGNSMIWGVQARTRWAATFYAPGKQPGTMDQVMVAGFVGFRRLRPTVQWLLQRVKAFDDKGGELHPANRVEEFETKGPGDVPRQIREFCSPDAPDLVIVDTSDGREVILPAGPVGNPGAFDIFTGGISRGLPQYRTPSEKMVSRAAAITLPVETLVFDVIAHRDIHMPSGPEVMLNGFPRGQIGDPRGQDYSMALPMSEQFIELAGSPPAVSTASVPRITKMVERIFSRMNWNGAEFRGMRMQVKYPPMSSVLVAQWPLPEQPGT
jgi:hypothetical protein